MKKSILFLVLIAVGITAQTLMATPGVPPAPTVPDAGSTALLVSAGCGGLMLVRKYLRR